MTGIGETLREARVRRRIELAQIEAETKIRAGYLAALEEERLDALPGKAYAKAFLRSYARYLGLPAEAMVAELDARLSPDEPSIAPLRMRPGRSFRVPAPALVLPLAAGLVVVGLLAAGQFSSSLQAPAVISLSGRAAPRPTTPARAAAQSRPAAPSPRVARIVLSAARGDCWLQVRSGSETGRILYEQILARGSSTSFAGRGFWIRIGAPSSLSVTLNGKTIDVLPRSGQPTNILVGPSRVRVL